MGKLFVIDGTDGSGKQTQFKKLQERLDKEGIEYKTVSFPNYDDASSSLVKMYLSGEFGENAKDVSPYIASTFYAADRYATYKRFLEKYYNEGGIILADRYTTANMVHQAGKISDKVEREKFLDWLWDFEFNLYGLPVPTKSFFLNMPPDYAIKLMENRENKFDRTIIYTAMFYNGNRLLLTNKRDHYETEVHHHSVACCRMQHCQRAICPGRLHYSTQRQQLVFYF